MVSVNELSQFTFTLTNEVSERDWICEKRRKSPEPLSTEWPTRENIYK